MRSYQKHPRKRVPARREKRLILVGETVSLQPLKTTSAPPKGSRDVDTKQQLLNDIIGAASTNDIQVNGVNAKCLIDTGSVISTISESFVVTFLKQVQIKELESLLENFTFESASGSEMDFIGYVETVIHIPGIGKYYVVLLVVKDTAFSRGASTSRNKHSP